MRNYCPYPKTPRLLNTFNCNAFLSCLLTFLCVAERVSLLGLWVFATVSSSVPPRSPPVARRARSVCRWWSGCTDSWRVPSGRPRRTKPRDWCSFGRWDAGPSDNLCSEKGGGRQDEQSRGVKRVKRIVKQIRRFHYSPLISLQIKGSIQSSLSLFFSFLLVPPFFLSLSESQNKTQSVVSPVNIMRISPEEI